jgi:hypothetical protein
MTEVRRERSYPNGRENSPKAHGQKLAEREEGSREPAATGNCCWKTARILKKDGAPGELHTPLTLEMR